MFTELEVLSYLSVVLLLCADAGLWLLHESFLQSLHAVYRLVRLLEIGRLLFLLLVFCGCYPSMFDDEFVV